MISVDAINGEIIQDVPLIINANVSGIAQTMYSGMQNITCDSYQDLASLPSTKYKLQETRTTTSGNSVTIKTLAFVDFANGIDYSNTNTYWTSGNWATFDQDQAALDAHWGVEKILDYWSSVHSRNGINETGLDIISIVNCYLAGPNNNASWFNNTMVFGSVAGWTSIDIVAHEMGHGISEATGNLAYRDESGALSEGFSDIWGACVTAWVNPTLLPQYRKEIWLWGEELFLNSSLYNCHRNMQNPKSDSVYKYPVYKYPDTYKGENWDFVENETHTNSTVLSHWFYILSVGKQGVNDNDDIYNTTGIGINKAEKIAYRTLCNLYPTADYNAARNMSIQAAIDLYGKCSQEEISVINAWHAVGLGDKSPYTTLQRTISNVIYSSNTTIKACSVTLNNVMILNNAKLTIEADEVNFNGEFNIYLGSELEIK